MDQRASGDNPATSYLAALSVLTLLSDPADPVRVGARRHNIRQQGDEQGRGRSDRRRNSIGRNARGGAEPLIDLAIAGDIGTGDVITATELIICHDVHFLAEAAAILTSTGQLEQS